MVPPVAREPPIMSSRNEEGRPTRGAPLASRMLQTFARFRGELVAVRLVRKLIVGLVRLIRLDDLHVGRLQLVELLLDLR
jgi:hypothetical protein